MAKISEILESLTLDDVVGFCESGNPNNAPEGIVEYLELLDKTRGMIDRFDLYPNDNIIINSLMILQGISKYKAKKIIEETREFFWKDTKTSVDAWSNYYAELIDKTIKNSILKSKDVKDDKAIVDMIKTAAILRGHGKEEKQELPEEIFKPRWVIYTTNAEELGLPKADRNKIKEFIDNKVPDLTEKERQRLYQEADIVPFKALPNVEEDPRKS